MSALEQRIAAALSTEQSSTEIAHIIKETQQATDDAEQAVERERVNALDLVASPDAAAAREALAAAEFTLNRLQTALPRLQNRFQQLKAEEYERDWRQEYEELRSRSETLAEEFRQVYPQFEDVIGDLMRRVAAMDQEMSRLGPRPTGVNLPQLQSVEVQARALEHAGAGASIIRELKLPSFDPTQPPAWPPPVIPAVVHMIEQGLLREPPFNPRWWEEREQRAEWLRTEHERAIEFYQDQARQREERENAEARERAVRLRGF